jgi:hypothetical protein
MPFAQAGPDLVGGVGAALALVAGDQDTGGGDPGEARDPEQLPPPSPSHPARLRCAWADWGMLSHMPDSRIGLAEALDLVRTGDLWLFRGRTPADRMIQTTTNSPVNHVGMAIVLDDLPPLMWHAELGRSLPDVWSGTHQRGVQLHDLRAAVEVWGRRYGQRAWLRQLSPTVGAEGEDSALRTVARLDGTPFPSTAQLATRWLRGRFPRPRRSVVPAAVETAYCAEVVAITYEAMGLLPPGRQPNWYDPGRFWSGDTLALRDGFTLGGEIAVDLPTAG